MAAEACCDLCALPLGRAPLEQVFDGQARAFCCTGCLNVYTILTESGAIARGEDFRQSELYLESLRLGLISNAAREARALPEGAEVRECLYQINGLWCTACGWLVEHALAKEYGVLSAEVIFTSDLLKLRYAPQFLQPDRIPARVAALGYALTEHTPGQDNGRAGRQDMLLRLGIAGGLWMNVMLFSLVIYASYFESISSWAARAIPFVLMALATPAVFYSAWPIHRLALLGLRQGVVRMEALISTGVFAAYLYSTVQAVAGGQHFYFDTACAIVTLVLTGKALERGAKEKTAQAIAFLHRLLPNKARLYADGRERFISIEALQPGMTLLVKPGERIPADATVVDGASSIDESVVTGESELQTRRAGDAVLGGSLNAAGALTLQVTRAAAESTLARIINSVEAALATRTPLERQVDRVSRYFVPAVTLLALATFFGWSLAGLAQTEAMLRAIAVLVIACPCALGIATPLATTAAVGAASRRGILVRDASVLETLRRIDLVVFDKTGTVTEGDFRVRETTLTPAQLAAVAALETRSEHPLAHALLRHARERALELPPVSEVAIHPGQGLSGRIGGVEWLVGNRALLGARGIDSQLEAQAALWEQEGLTVAFAAMTDGITGAIAFGDRLRPDARPLVAELRRRGLRTVLLSGDSERTTARIAAQLEVSEHHAAVPPDRKAETLRAYQAQGLRVAMLGDGINDAPALAAADLGIAMGSGTDLAMHAAPVVLVSSQLSRVVEIFDLARLTLRVVSQNLFWAFAYNALGISLAIAGVLNPILAAAAMILSSLSVIANSLRIRATRRS